MIYFDQRNSTFYDDNIHIAIPKWAIPINVDMHQKLLQALNLGCVIGEDLAISPPPPSKAHTWNGTEWVIDEIKKSELIAQQRETIRQQINAKRDTCVDGGVYVPMIDKWVDTDKKGRSTLVEIKADFDLNGKENTYTLICADNTAKTINFEEFKAVWDAAKTLKEKMYENAYMHKILLEAEENPLDYDWSIGWCKTYEEHKNEQTQK